MVLPLDDAALKSEGFSLGSGLPTIMLSNPGSFVKERAPVVCRPFDGRASLHQRDNLGLVLP